MNPPPVTIKSYLPPEKRERSKLQQVKDKYRSFTQTNTEGLPKDLIELKDIKYREHAITFMHQYMNINKKTSKSKYCKTNHISHHSLNTGLKLIGYKTRIKEPNQALTSPIEPNKTQAKKVMPKRAKTKTVSDQIEVKAAGTTYEDEEINEMINNSLANLSTS